MRRIICVFLSLLLCMSLAAVAFAAEDTDFLYDEADLLTAAEEASLTSKLERISAEYEAQIVVATIASMNGGNVDLYLDYLYDSMGFGYGERYDGVLLLICMDPREYRILSNGYAGVAIDPDDIGRIGDRIVSDLSAGNYADAFHAFAEECEYYLNGYINGFPFAAGENLGISAIIGIVIGLIVVFVLKGQLKTVQKQSRAHDYVKSGSMQVNVMNDIFLYRNVTRTKRQTSSSSGSSRSSGGSARSRGGGSF